MLPLGIVGRKKYRPYVTFGLIIVNILVFIWELSVNAQGPTALQTLFAGIAFDVCKVGTVALPEMTLDAFRSMFLHGSLGHLIGNMLFLWVFGRQVEAYFGRGPYLAFYIGAGFVATLGHAFLGGIVCDVNDSSVLIGASGAIAGVMGSFLFLYPSARVDTIIGFFAPLIWRARIPALFYLAYWFLMDFLQGVGWIYSAGIAHWAHIGGFVAGFAVAFVATMLYKPAPKPDPFEYLDD